MQVYFALAKRVEGLRAGMLAQVSLRIGAEQGISLPVSAVLIKDGKRRVVYVATRATAVSSRAKCETGAATATAACRSSKASKPGETSRRARRAAARRCRPSSCSETHAAPR